MNFLLSYFALIPLSFAHSHLECTDYDNGVCRGFPRQYSVYKQGYEGTAESKDRNFIVAAGTQTCPASAGGEDYTEKYPAARVSPGQQVTLHWPPRGHSSQPNSPVWINCSPMSGKQNPTLESETERIAEMPYDNCEGSDVSWAVCTGSFSIPTSWKAGETRTCQWVWILNGGQKYVDCFEYEVVAPGQAKLVSSSPSSLNQTILTTDADPFHLKAHGIKGKQNTTVDANPVKTLTKTLKIAPEVDDLCAHIVEICAKSTSSVCPHVLSECGQTSTATEKPAKLTSLKVTPVLDMIETDQPQELDTPQDDPQKESDSPVDVETNESDTSEVDEE